MSLHHLPDDTRSRRGRRPAIAQPAAAETATVAPIFDDDTIISMTIKEAARVTGFSKDALYDLLGAGEIKSFRMASRRYIDAASLRAYVARRAAEPVSLRRGPNTRDGRQAGGKISAAPKSPEPARVRIPTGPPETIVHAPGAKK